MRGVRTPYKILIEIGSVWLDFRSKVQPWRDWFSTTLLFWVQTHRTPASGTNGFGVRDSATSCLGRQQFNPKFVRSNSFHLASKSRRFPERVLPVLTLF